jgi:hypothetical protein
LGGTFPAANQTGQQKKTRQQPCPQSLANHACILSRPRSISAEEVA